MNKFLLITLTLLFPLGLYAREQLRELDGVAAVVGDSVILKSEVNAFVEMKIQASGAPADALMRNMLYDEALDELIDGQVLLVHTAQDTNVIVTNDDVNKQVNSRLAMIMQQNKLTEEQLIKALEQEQGMSYSDFRDKLAMQAEQEIVRQKVQQFYLMGSEMSREEVRQFYEGYKDSLPPVGESVKLQKIEIALEPDSVLRQEAYTTISTIRQKVVELGDDFSELAKAHSAGPNASNGGDLGFISKGTFSLIRLEQKIFTLQPGEVSEIIETRLGFHLVKVLERQENRVHALHILISVTPSEELVRSETAFLDSVRTAAPDSAAFAELIKEKSSDPVSRAYSGIMDWQVVSKLDASVRKNLTDFTVGAYSPVITKDNTLFLYRVVEHDKYRKMDLESNWTQIEQFARQMTIQEKLSDLVKKWRTKIFIQKYR